MDQIRTEAEIIEAVRKDLWALKDVPEDMKTEAVCLAAVSEHGGAMAFVPEKMRTVAVCRAAMDRHPSVAQSFVPHGAWLRLRLEDSFTDRGLFTENPAKVLHDACTAEEAAPLAGDFVRLALDVFHPALRGAAADGMARALDADPGTDAGMVWLAADTFAEDAEFLAVRLPEKSFRRAMALSDALRAAGAADACVQLDAAAAGLQMHGFSYEPEGLRTLAPVNDEEPPVWAGPLCVEEARAADAWCMPASMEVSAEGVRFHEADSGRPGFLVRRKDADAVLATCASEPACRQDEAAEGVCTVACLHL